MNEWSERFSVVLRKGGHPEHWDYQQVGDKREFHIHDARHLLSQARANASDPNAHEWVILDAGHGHPPEDWLGLPHHPTNQNTPRHPRPHHVTFLAEAAVPPDFKPLEAPDLPPQNAPVRPNLTLRQRIANLLKR